MDYSGSNQPNSGSQTSGDSQYQYKDPAGAQGTNPPPPQPPPPPPPPAKSFNWLACCGISCGVSVVLIGIVGLVIFQAVKPFMNMGMEMEQTMSSVQNTDAATVKSAATPTTPDALNANTADLKGKWLAIEGVIVGDGGSIAGEFTSGTNSSSGSGAGYLLANNTIVMDTSGAASVGALGDTIRAYGQVFTWDLTELGQIPIVGNAILESMANEPQMAGNTKIIFFIAKEVELVGTRTEENPCSPDAPEETIEPGDKTQDDGWL